MRCTNCDKPVFLSGNPNFYVIRCHDCGHTGRMWGCEHGFNEAHTYCEHDGVKYYGKHD